MTTAVLPDLSARERVVLGLPETEQLHKQAVRTSKLALIKAWISRHAVSLAIMGPLLELTYFMHSWGAHRAPALGDDEGTYIAQAWAVQTGHGLAHYTYWYDHPPFGWITLAGWTWITGAFDGHGLSVLDGRTFMVLLSVLDAALIYLLARRLGVARLWSALAVILWSLSPLTIEMSRMVLLDNLALPWLLGAFVLAASPRASLWAQVGSGICFAAAVLTKETSLVLVPALLYVAWRSTERQTRAFCMVGIGSALVLVVAAYPLLAALKGELFSGPGHVSLTDALRFQFVERPSTGSLLSPSSGSNHTAADWVRRDWILLVLGLLAMVPALIRRKTRAVGVALALLLLVAIKPGYLPQPYIVAVMPFAALAVAGTLEAVAGWLRGSMRESWPRELAGATLAAAVLLAIIPGWLHGTVQASTGDTTTAVRQAELWMQQHKQKGAVLVDDTIWVDLVSAGYAPQDVIWFYKLDFVNNLDPSVRRRVDSYKDLRVLVVTPIVRAALDANAGSLQLVRDAIAHSTPEVTFGTDEGRVEIRIVQ